MFLEVRKRYFSQGYTSSLSTRLYEYFKKWNVNRLAKLEGNKRNLTFIVPKLDVSVDTFTLASYTLSRAIYLFMDELGGIFAV